jgi:hypothetical protein
MLSVCVRPQPLGCTLERCAIGNNTPAVSEFSDRLAASRNKLAERKGTSKTTSGGGDSPANQQAAASLPPSLSGEKPRRAARKAERAPTAAPADVHRMPPHSVEMELGVLSSIMADAQFGSKGFTVLAEVASKITPDYFYVPAHKTIYESFLHLWRAGIAIELIGFTDWMRNHKLLDSVGGAAYVTQLINYVPTAANVQHYTEVLTDLMRRREAIADGTRLVRAAYAAMDEDAFIEQVQRIHIRLGALTSYNGKYPAMIDTADFCPREEIKLPPLVIHYLLHQGSKMLLGGNSKGRKTWALMDLATSVACGAEWWGFPTRKGCVCYVNLELQQAFFQQRLQTIWEKRSLYPERGSLLVWNLRGHAKPMEALVNDLLTFLQQYRFTLIIIDPIYKTLPATHGAENDSAIVTQLLNSVESIAVETGAAVLFSSHFSKGDQSEKEAMDRVSGSGAWSRDPDSHLTMSPHEEGECYTVHATLRNLAPPKEFVVKWEYPIFSREDELDPANLKRRGAAEQKFDVAQIMEQLDEPLRTQEWQKRTKDETGMSPRTFYSLLSKAEKEGMITKNDEKQWIPKTGEERPF